MAALFLLTSSAWAQEQELPREEVETAPKKKRPGFFLHRPAMDSPESQLAYADGLLARGRVVAARRQYNALVHEWHDTPDAVLAQMACARLYEERRRYDRAFDEFQYLIDNYSGQFPYEEALDHQYRIARYRMTARTLKILGLPGFSAPERAIPLLEQIVQNAPDWDKAPEAQVCVGRIHEADEQYELAIDAYDMVAYRYPMSAYAIEARLGVVDCLYRASVSAPRDKELCRRALSAASAFVRDYPGQEGNERARRHMAALRDQLAGLYYDVALFYDRTAKRPEAALIAYRDFIKRFPSAQQASDVADRMDVLAAEVKREKIDE